MATDRELLMRIVRAYEQHEKEREESFQKYLATYNPNAEGQPCADREMSAYDEMNTDWAFDAENLLSDFVNDARKHMEMEKN